MKAFLEKIKDRVMEMLGHFSERLRDELKGVGAVATIEHRRPTRWLDDGTPDPDSYELLWREVTHNVVTKVGKDFLLAQCYATAPSWGTNGLNFIGLSNSAFTEDADSTVLSGEITANGFARAQATTIAHTAGTAFVTISKLFTCTTANQSVQKAALFDRAGPPPTGIMGHALPFSLQRNCAPGDTILTTWVITFTG